MIAKRTRKINLQIKKYLPSIFSITFEASSFHPASFNVSSFDKYRFWIFLGINKVVLALQQKLRFDRFDIDLFNTVAEALLNKNTYDLVWILLAKPLRFATVLKSVLASIFNKKFGLISLQARNVTKFTVYYEMAIIYIILMVQHRSMLN